MKKKASVLIVTLVAAVLAFGCGQTAPEEAAAEETATEEAAGETAADEASETADAPQSASAYLDQGENTVVATVDLSGGWSVEFARGAVYLYDGEITDGKASAAMGSTLTEDVYKEYIAEYSDAENSEKLENGLKFTEEDGSTDFVFTIGDTSYFILSVTKDYDADEVFARLTLEPEYIGEEDIGDAVVSGSQSD